MGNSFRLDDLLGKDTTEKKPPRKKGATAQDGFALDDLLGPDSSTAPAPDTGDVVLFPPPEPEPVASVAPVPAPAPRRGIADRIGESLAQANQFMSRDRDPEVRKAVGLPARETRTPAIIPDRTTAAEKLARAKQALDATIAQRPDQTSVTERGGVQAIAEQAAVRDGLAADEARKARFSPEAWRDIARRGMELQSKLHGEGRHEEAEDTGKRAYNAQLLADGAENADTYGAIALSAMLGIVSDPFEGERRNMAEIQRTPGATFDDARAQKELGIDEQVPTARGFDFGKDVGAYGAGSVVPMVLGGVAGRVGVGLAGRALAARGMPRAAKIAQALAAEIESTTIPAAERLSGGAGLRQAAGNLRENVGRLATRGAVEGQIVGMAQAARAAQDVGDSPLEAAITEGVFGAGLGAVGEVLGGALTRVAGVGLRTATSTRIGQAISRSLERPSVAGAREVPMAKGAVETAADVPVTPEAAAVSREVGVSVETHRASLAEALADVLDQKSLDDNFGSDVGLIERDRGYLTPRGAGEPDAPLRTAAEIAMDEGGVPAPRPADNANAVVQMFRAAEERRALDAQVRADEDAARIEIAATKRAAEKQGPLPLSTTIMRATREADADAPLAVEYRDAIDRFADVSARMKDSAGAPSEKLKLDWAKARSTLNAARKKYGVEAGAAGILALASADEDLTDEERQMIGVGALAIGAQRVIPAKKPGMSPAFRQTVKTAFEAVRADPNVVQTALTKPRTYTDWLDWFSEVGVKLGARYDDVSNRLFELSGYDSSEYIPAEKVEAIFDEGEPDEYAGLSRGFRSRLRDAVETLPGKAWDQPRPVGDWIGKLKGAGTFSKAELTMVQPTLDEWQAAKRKVTRGDMLALLDERLPQIDRLTFAEEPSPPKQKKTGQRFTDPDDVLVDVDEINDTWHRDAIEEQIAARKQKIAETKEQIEARQNEAENEKDYAETRQNDAADEVEKTLEKFGGGVDAQEWRRKIEDMLSEDIQGDYIPRGLVDKVYREFVESGEANVVDELPSLDDMNFSTEEIPNPTDDSPDAEPWARVTDPNGETYDAPSTWEAMAHFDREELSVPHGGEGRLMPKNVKITKEKSEVIEWIIRDSTGDIHDRRRKSSWLNMTDDRYEDALREEYASNDGFTVERGENEPVWTLRGSDGHVEHRGTPGETREEMVERFVRDNWEASVDSSAFDELHGDIDTLADRMAAASEAESQWYNYTESPEDAFDNEYTDISKWEEELRDITPLYDRAPVDVPPLALAPGEPVDPDAPLPIRTIGNPHYKTYQRIPGGTEYRELVNSWVNTPSGNPIKTEAYGVYPNHDYWSTKGAPSSVGHLRAEVHTIRQTPGLSGEKVELPPDSPPDIKQQYDFIAENRKKRGRLLDEMQRVADEYEKLPAAETNPKAPSQRAMSLAHEYDDFNNQVLNIGKQEDAYVENIHNLRGRLLGENEAPPERVLNFLESQTSLSQFQVSMADVSVDDIAELPQKLAEAAAESRVFAFAESAARDKYYEANGAWDSISRNKLGYTYMESLRKEWESVGLNDLATLTEYGVSSDVFADPAWKPVWDRIEQDYPGTIEIVRAANEAQTYLATVEAANAKAEKKHREIANLMQNTAGKVDVGMFSEIDNAQAYNAARAWIEFGEGDHGALMFSDAANRIRNAHLPRRAARRWYDELWPAAHKRVLRFLGLKEGSDFTFEHTFVKGEGHWKITPTDPAKLRRLIREHGVYPLALVAMASQTAEAQDGEAQASPYSTFVGGIVAGGALVALAGNKKLRKLVAENAELRTALMRDDMSGLANKTAHARAIESVDRDPNTAWLAFDGDQFKTLNDTHGHPEGDKAIMHFGRVIRDASERAGVPMRGFRAGGDEFAMAVPKERAAEVLRLVEDMSSYTKGNVTTKLTGSIGDAWDEADALLTAAKETNRLMNPEFKRIVVRPDMQKALTEEIERALGTGLKLYSNPIGPALKELRKYPSAAAIGVVGYAMGESDNDNIQRAGVPVMALAALSAIGSRRLIDGKDALASKLVNVLRQTPEGTKAVRAFNPDALLDPAVREAILQYERDAAKGKARSVEFSAKAKNLGGEGDRAVSDVLDNEEWEDRAHFTAEQTTDVLSVAGELAAEYDRLTKAQVNAGVLDQSQVLPNYGGPRRYAYFEALDALADSPSNLGKPGRRPRIAAVKQRTLDVPLREAEDALKVAQAGGDQAAIEAANDALDEAKVVQMSQRVQLGEIREASYRAAQGIERAHHAVASAQLFHTIRNVPGSAHPEWEQAVDDMLAAKQMFKSATSKADKDAAELMQNSAAVALDEITKKYRGRDGEYVSLPDTPGLGVLRGAVVKRDIAHSLEGFGTPGLYGKTLRAWKEIKTVFNLGTSIGNILSNITALHVGEVPMWLQPYYLTTAVKDLRGYGEGTRALAEAGVLNVNAVNALGTGELGAAMRKEEGLEELLTTTRPETQQVLRQQGITEERTRGKLRRRQIKGMAVGAGIGAAKGYDDENPENAATGAAIGAGIGAVFGGKGANFVRRLYDNEDNVARLAVFHRRRRLGDTIEQATEKARESLGNFRSRSPALKLVSSTVSPFVLYQAKAVPAFAMNVVDHPWKFLSLIAAWGAVNELGEAEMGEVPESDIPVNQRRKLGYFLPGFTQLGFGDEQGNKAAVDAARWTPLSGLTTGAPPGSIPEAFGDDGMALVTPGGPVIDAALKGSNIDPYRKEPLLQRDRPTAENVETLANAAADFVLPSMLGIHAKRLKEDIDNADWTKFKNDLLGVTGAKPRYIRPGAVAMDAAYTLRRSLADMRQEFRKELRANKDPARVKLLGDRYNRRVATALTNFKERIGTPPDSDVVNEFLKESP